jgi:predicted RNA methylase
MSVPRFIQKFILDSVARDKSLFFKVEVERRGFKYTKYFAVNENIEILTYTIVNNNAYKGNSKLMNNTITLKTVCANYNGFYKTGRIVSITKEDFDRN